MVVGTNSLSKTNKLTKIYRVKGYIHHPEFDMETVANDIGLIKVDKKIKFNEKVQPIKLMNSDFDKINYPAVLTGWGRFDVKLLDSYVHQ